MTESRPKHSPIGASGRYRWRECPASVKLSEKVTTEEIPGAAAIEGTLAHEVVASLLQQSFDQNEDINEILKNYTEAIKLYLDYVSDLKQKCTIALIEHAFDMGALYPNLYGTADAVLLEGDVLHVVDFKFGKEIVVEAEENPQLEYYALGALKTLSIPCKHVNMTIVQPRAYHPLGPIRSWQTNILHFLDVEQQLLKEVKETENPDAKFKFGKHCIFCRAHQICPEKHNARVEAARREFADKPIDPTKHFEDVTNSNFDDVTKHITPVESNDTFDIF